MPYNRNDDFDNYGSNNFNSLNDEFFDSLGGYDPSANTGYDTNGSFQNGTGYSSDYTTKNYYPPQENFAEQNESDNSISNDYSADNNAEVINTLTYSNTKQLENEQSGSFNNVTPNSHNNAYGFIVTEEMIKRNRTNNIRVIVVLLVFSIIFVGLMFYASFESLKNQNNDKAFLDNSFIVNGTVTKIEVEKTDKNFSYRARVVCNAPDGSVVVPNKSFPVDTSVKEGDVIQLLMSKDDIHDVRSKSGLDLIGGTLTITAAIIVGLSFLAILIGLIVHYVRFKKDPYNFKYYRKEKNRYIRNQKYGNNNYKDRSLWTMQIGGRTVESSPVHSSSSNNIDNTYYGSSSNQIGSTYQGNSSMSNKNGKIRVKEFTVKDYVIGIIFGLVWLIGFSIPVGIFIGQQVERNSFMDSAVAVNAKVTHITVERHTSSHKTGKTHTSSTSYLYYATVEYQWDNNWYKGGKIKIDPSINNGDTILVYIDPDNPSDCRDGNTAGDNMGNILGIITLGPFCIVGLVIIILCIRGAIRAHSRKLRE